MSIFALRWVLLLSTLTLSTSCSMYSGLPDFSDVDGERSCACLIENDCPFLEYLEIAVGKSENRNFQCNLVAKDTSRAVCTFESRFASYDERISEAKWNQVTVKLRRTNWRGWCWTEYDSSIS
ncbi:hypothetical protein [Parasphingorhabdus litoris]|uniref:hypothetical protein n=1 Tax=Parasphingorhabdus litoris TaxID=394733 RepID=UPI001E33DBB4|nr:hypothetical protein [Parasphingorhabdus litoris]